MIENIILTRDGRRFYCDSCNNFPFKTEVHKCPGTGLETYFSSDPAPESPLKRSRSGSENIDPTKTKSLEELAREVEKGTIDMEKLVKRKQLYAFKTFISLNAILST